MKTIYKSGNYQITKENGETFTIFAKNQKEAQKLIKSTYKLNTHGVIEINYLNK